MPLDATAIVPYKYLTGAHDAPRSGREVATEMTMTATYSVVDRQTTLTIEANSEIDAALEFAANYADLGQGVALRVADELGHVSAYVARDDGAEVSVESARVGDARRRWSELRALQG